VLEVDRPRFNTMLAELFAAIDKPLGEAKEGAFWKGLARMSLVDFARVSESLIAGLETRDAPKFFTVSDIWAARRNLRARGPESAAPGAGDNWQGDEWDVRANLHLLAYIRATLGANPRIWGAPNSDEQAAATAVLVRFKRAWAQDMREWGGEVSPEESYRAWHDCMRRAEAQIWQRRAA
jgi:hypothetical protein